ncbi:RNA polymerase sigma factor [Ferdinandcohnia quinoae]|uniref:RNA polymerase sigma factor n=1 Tax=Fredinandcohnia quinoae TaxID=2918902 RepID=A0AAW5E6M0_9BACI|nr:RNA polymerase sigma factor [Fredinandcohnia sp. SECRCQ15]MCH1626885.1 RNA polymerase sigma factor [Fredinandcohnia sp. SECRCQ15]
MSQKESRELFTQFVLEHKESVYRLAYSYVKNEQDALDIVQDSIYKGLKSLKSIQKQPSMKSWFYRIVVNTSLDFLRKNKRIQLVGDEWLEIHASVVDMDIHNLDLEQAYEHLPIKYREVVGFRFFDDLKLEEIAAVLDLSVNTIKTRLYRALEMLRINLEEGEIEHE